MVTIHTFIHCFAVNHWREIMAEFARKMRADDSWCDRQIVIGFSGSKDEAGYLWHLFGVSGWIPDIRFVSLADYEMPTLEMMRLRALELPKDAVMQYLHTKGVSRPNDWVATMWRWFMNTYSFDPSSYPRMKDWTWSAPMVSAGGDCSVGNFFYAKAEHMARLMPVADWVDLFRGMMHRREVPQWMSIRHAAEFFVGSVKHPTIDPYQVFSGAGFPIFAHQWWASNPDFQRHVITQGS